MLPGCRKMYKSRAVVLRFCRETKLDSDFPDAPECVAARHSPAATVCQPRFQVFQPDVCLFNLASVQEVLTHESR